jgi:hypothetical protein
VAKEGRFIQYNIRNRDKMREYNKLYWRQKQGETSHPSLSPSPLSSSPSPSLCPLAPFPPFALSTLTISFYLADNTVGKTGDELTPKTSWKSVDELRIFLDSLAEKLHVHTAEDWYRTSRDQIRKLGGLLSARLFQRIHSPEKNIT